MVTDPAGRFLPLFVDLTLPSRGLAEWPGWTALPQDPLAPLVDRTASLPLFSSAGRTAPSPLATIRAQLIREDSGAPAAWALLTAAHAGTVRAIVHADAQGRVVLFFSYPASRAR